MENSKIEWTHHTFNTWKGCNKVSPGCKNCYAETWGSRFGVQWGPMATRVRTSKQYWFQPHKWNRQAEKEGTRYRVFCSSLADVFEDKPDQPEMDIWRAELLAMILDTPNLDWLLLTKRPENVNSMIKAAGDWWFENGAPTTYGKKLLTWMKHGESFSPANVWIGTSVENQEQANKRIPILLDIPARVRFLSMEPLLGPVDLRSFEYGKERGLTVGYDWLTGTKWTHSDIFGGGNPMLDRDDIDEYGANRINWVIVGGESGTNARPMHPDWARSIRDQCVDTGVPFFFKQWGEWIDYSNLTPELFEIVRDGGHISNATTFDDLTPIYKFGKHKTGRLLDGMEWNQFPE